MKSRILIAVLVAGSLAFVLACGGSSAPTSPTGSSANPPSNGSQQTGTVSVSLKDSPFSDASALLIKFSDVSVHNADTGAWMPLAIGGGTGSVTCDLKKLTNAQDLLGSATLTAGTHYTQIRIVVSSATIYFGGTSSAVCSATNTVTGFTSKADVNVPSGELKLVRQFTVPSGGATSILLDFDGDKSVNQLGNGKYQMSPVIKVVSVQ